jgi:hypothetical protein
MGAPFLRSVVLTRDEVATRSGFNYRAGGCGQKTWRRSIVAFVRLPHAKNSASLSQHTIAIARVRDGWVLWAIIH